MASLLFVKSSCFHLRESCYAQFIRGKTLPHCPIILFNYFFKEQKWRRGALCNMLGIVHDFSAQLLFSLQHIQTQTLDFSNSILVFTANRC